MMDLTTEMQVQQLSALAAQTGSFNGTGVSVATFNTGDIDLATLSLIVTTGSGTITGQLQGSATLNGAYTNLAVTPAMPNTAFPAQAASTTAPINLPIDPRGLPPFVRLAVTAVGITAFTLESQLFSRPLQVGFNSNSG